MAFRVRTRRPLGAEIPLWASAFVIGALVVVEAGSLPAPAAHAGEAVIGGTGFSMATVRASANGENGGHELLYVIDGRDELLYVYEIPKASDRRIVFLGGRLLPSLFADGRGG